MGCLFLFCVVLISLRPHICKFCTFFLEISCIVLLVINKVSICLSIYLCDWRVSVKGAVQRPRESPTLLPFYIRLWSNFFHRSAKATMYCSSLQPSLSSSQTLHPQGSFLTGSHSVAPKYPFLPVAWLFLLLFFCYLLVG